MSGVISSRSQISLVEQRHMWVADRRPAYRSFAPQEGEAATRPVRWQARTRPTALTKASRSQSPTPDAPTRSCRRPGFTLWAHPEYSPLTRAVEGKTNQPTPVSQANQRPHQRGARNNRQNTEQSVVLRNTRQRTIVRYPHHAQQAEEKEAEEANQQSAREGAPTQCGPVKARKPNLGDLVASGGPALLNRYSDRKL